MISNRIISKNQLVQKIEFKLVNTDFRTVIATYIKYIYLKHLFISNIQETVGILQMVQSGNKIWKEIMVPFKFLQIDYAGEM